MAVIKSNKTRVVVMVTRYPYINFMKSSSDDCLLVLVTITTNLVLLLFMTAIPTLKSEVVLFLPQVLSLLRSAPILIVFILVYCPFLFMSFFGYAQYFELYKHKFCNNIFPMPDRQYVQSEHIVRSDSMVRQLLGYVT